MSWILSIKQNILKNSSITYSDGKKILVCGKIFRCETWPWHKNVLFLLLLFISFLCNKVFNPLAQAKLG